MTKSVKVALDAMGGDAGPSVCVPAAQQILTSNKDLCLYLVGKQEVIKPLLNGSENRFGDRLQIIDAREVVAMDESPADALRKKKNFTSNRLKVIECN